MQLNPLQDKFFLKELDQQKERIIYARVVVLDWEEYPIVEISGMVTGGSVNIDGSSTVRRTCSLSLVTSTIDMDDMNWALRTKFNLFIGMQNNVSKDYEDIIWFPQGMFILSSYSCTLNSSGYTISLSGKDKMCLINGDIGGALFASHDFGKEWLIKRDGTYETKSLLIRDIIKEAIHTYAQEPYRNIIINDLNTCGVELVEYKGDTPLYVYSITYPTTGNTVLQIALPSDGAYEQCAAHFRAGGESWLESGATYTVIKKCSYGDTAGFRPTDLTYTGDLVVNVNETITNMLDKIVKMLGEFEYFYDTAGHFIFQRKPTYFNVAWSNIVQIENETYYDATVLSSSFAYEFDSGYLIESFANKPNLTVVKNDFSVWGQRSIASGETTAIHMRYAIDIKPQGYYSLKRRTAYLANPLGMDWRQLIYMMAEDNLIAHDRIEAIKVALNQNFYQLNPDKIPMTDLYKWYNFCYWFDGVSKKFYQMGTKIDDDGNTTQDPVYGQEQLRTYIVLGNAIWTKDPTLTYYSVTDAEIVALRHRAEELISGDPTILGLHQRVLDTKADYENYVNSYETHIAALNEQYSAAPAGLVSAVAQYQAEYEHNKKIKYTAYLEALAAEPTVNDIINGTYPINDAQLEQALQVTTTQIIVARNKTAMEQEIKQWEATFNTGYDAYYTDMLAFWPKLYKKERTIQYEYNDDGTITRDQNGNLVEAQGIVVETQPDGTYHTITQEVMTVQEFERWRLNNYWNPDLFYSDRNTGVTQIIEPESLNFWIDFIDEKSELQQFLPMIIGRRAKALKDDQIGSIYYKDVPSILLIDAWKTEDAQVQGYKTLGYQHINLTKELASYFTISTQKKSAKEELESMVYDCTYYQDTITIVCLPIYYLEPNTRIFVQDKNSGINGEYYIKSFNYSLAHDGMMNITANKVGQRII